MATSIYRKIPQQITSLRVCFTLIPTKRLRTTFRVRFFCSDYIMWHSMSLFRQMTFKHSPSPECCVWFVVQRLGFSKKVTQHFPDKCWFHFKSQVTVAKKCSSARAPSLSGRINIRPPCRLLLPSPRLPWWRSLTLGAPHGTLQHRSNMAAVALDGSDPDTGGEGWRRTGELRDTTRRETQAWQIGHSIRAPHKCFSYL